MAKKSSKHSTATTSLPKRSSSKKKPSKKTIKKFSKTTSTIYNIDLRPDEVIDPTFYEDMEFKYKGITWTNDGTGAWYPDFDIHPFTEVSLILLNEQDRWRMCYELNYPQKPAYFLPSVACSVSEYDNPRSAIDGYLLSTEGQCKDLINHLRRSLLKLEKISKSK